MTLNPVVRRLPPIAIGVVALVVACGGIDERFELTGAVAQQASELDLVSDADQANCVAAALVGNRPVAELAADGLSVESVNAGGTVADYVFDSSTAMKDTITACFEPAVVFGEAFSVEAGADAMCAEREVSEDRAEAVLSAMVDGDDPGIDSRDAEDRRVALACGDEDVLVTFLGFDRPTDVAVAYSEVLQRLDGRTDTEADCLADPVRGYSVERLEELNITVEDIAGVLTHPTPDFSDDELEELVETVLSCVDVRAEIAENDVGTWPEIVPCVANGLDDDDIRSFAKARLEQSAYDAARQARFRDDLLVTCGEDYLEQLFGPVDLGDRELIELVGRNLSAGLTGFNSDVLLRTFEEVCLGHGVLSQYTPAQVAELDELYFTSDGDLDSLYTNEAYRRGTIVINQVFTQCVSFDNLLATVLVGLDFSQETLSCLHQELTIDTLRALAAGDSAFLSDDAGAINRFWDAFEEFEIVLEGCATQADWRTWTSIESEDLTA